MDLSPSEQLLLVLVTFFFSVVGGITGIGIATILLPLLIFLGVNLPFAKATALWINISVMSLSVYKRLKSIKLFLALPLVVSAFLFSPLGAKLSFYIPQRVQLLLLASFVFISALAILFLKPKARIGGVTKLGFIKVGILLGGFAGFIGGMLGIGGGIIANPLLIILGFDPLVVTSVSSLMVLLSSLSGWITYAAFGYFSYSLTLPLFISAVAGSYIGNLLSQRISKEAVKKVVGYFALLVAIVTYLKAFTL
ncbi:MAG TPA: sulfite exporter TauE/SafE family protein [Aquifex aeolicus]|uniref:Probable membrane transporter protein n=1 Tax=Aquifex aeolicus TaxID=63363 RepID=A0A9D0YR70_AQUAO|nr:sulfite exporter TauE/SafE family protein [Aquificales bacterium]HIP98705.1 sulfite exporter TauE/SafE family protein [Aquifex aeolicus]HIQ25894.1 sulfite exporter TauE/SafE family protein [Aquifex aeolicus]